MNTDFCIYLFTDSFIACPPRLAGNAFPVPQGSGSWHRLQGQMLTLKENSKNTVEKRPHELWKVRAAGAALQSPRNLPQKLEANQSQPCLSGMQEEL